MQGVLTTGSITFGTASFKIASMPGGKDESAEAVEVTSLDDTKHRFVPGAITKEDEVEVTVYDDGTMPEINMADALSMTGVISDGETTENVGGSWVRVILTKKKYGTIEADGDRKAVCTLTFTPCGQSAS